MVYLAEGGFWLGIGQIVSSLSAFLISIAFANLLPIEVYGVYKYILSIVSLIAVTTLTGMDSAITQSISRGFEGTLTPAIKTRIKWGVLGSILSLLTALYYYTQGNPTFTVAFSIVAIFMPFYESLDMYNSLLFGKKLFSVYTHYNTIRKIVGLLIIVVTLLLTDNLSIIILAFFFSTIIPTIFFLYKTIHTYQTNSNLDREALSYGKHLSLINVLSTILGQLDKILIFHYVGAVNLAIYALATAPTDQIKGLLKNINLLALPKFANQTKAEIAKTIWGKVWILLLVSSTIVLVYIIIAPLFFGIFFPKYLTSISYSQLISISLIPVIISGFLYTTLEAQKSKKNLYEWNIYTNIFNLILLFPLVYYLGLLGAIASKTLTRLFGLLLSVIFIRNYKNQEYNENTEVKDVS